MRTGDDVLNVFERLFEAERCLAMATHHARLRKLEAEQAEREVEAFTEVRDRLVSRMRSLAKSVANVADEDDDR